MSELVSFLRIPGREKILTRFRIDSGLRAEGILKGCFLVFLKSGFLIGLGKTVFDKKRVLYRVGLRKFHGNCQKMEKSDQK